MEIMMKKICINTGKFLTIMALMLSATPAFAFYGTFNGCITGHHCDHDTDCPPADLGGTTQQEKDDVAWNTRTYSHCTSWGILGQICCDH